MRRDLALIVTLCLTATAAAPAAGPQASTATPRAASSSAGFTLSVDSIMRGPRLVGYPPSGLRWSGDSRDLFFEWRQPGEDEAATWTVVREGGAPRRLTDEERKSAPPTGGVWDKARRRVLFVDAGDIVLVDTVARVRRQITRTTAGEGNPRWTRNETHVTFTRENNLFILSLDGSGSGLLEQLTDVGPKRSDPKLTESQKFLKEEELKLLDAVREQAERRKKAEERREKDRQPKFEIAEGQTVADLQLSPDERHVYVLVSERATGARRADVPTFITEAAYAEMLPARTNVGDAQDRRRLAVVNLKTGKSVWVKSTFAGDAPPAPTPTGPQAADAPANGQEPAQPAAAASRGGREVRWNMPSLSEDGRLAVSLARAFDNKDRWLVAVSPETGDARVIDHLHDEAWVRDGSGMGWLADNKRFYFLSERDGWMHLHVIDASSEGARPVQLTTGKWEVASVQLARDRTKFYFHTSEVHPGERHLYSMTTDGGPRTKITSMTGAHEGDVSPDDTTIGFVYSYSTKPPDVHLMPNRPGAEARQVTTSTSDEWRSFKWADPQLVTFKARDGAAVYARLFTPEMLSARRDPRRPGVVFVHGAGYLQNAHKSWSTYFREYMFHNLLASRGYVVLDVDYRASAGYGRDWRTAIYRHMGGKDLEDIVDGAKYLSAQHKVDARRIGVYGGSYGGFITLMAMFTTPDVFAAGAALRPVTDWAHYNHGYTSNILNEPHKDAEAYRRSSPIYFAEGLKGALLICHGMVDVNVHFQDSVRLAQRLIELRKENWELAPYPVEDHGFERETSWADEYKRILSLFENNLRLR